MYRELIEHTEDIDIKDLEKYFLASSQWQAPRFSPKTFITHNKVILRLINISNSNAFTIFILTNIICQVFFVRCSLRGHLPSYSRNLQEYWRNQSFLPPAYRSNPAETDFDTIPAKNAHLTGL